MIKTVKNLILGNARLQTLFQTLYKIGLKGMNYDRGQVVEHSGEEYVLDYVRRRFAKPTLTIFDVGANYGQYSNMAIKKLKENINIYAFEPQKKAFQHLVNEIKYPHFQAFNEGLGNACKNEILYNGIEGSGFGSLNKSSHEHVPDELVNKETVYIETLDHFCEKERIDHIDLLKIDVEGYEIEVLKGAQRMIENGRINCIQFEVGPATLRERVIMKDFFKMLHHYDIHRILSNGLTKINYSEYAEIFLCTNYLAVRKSFTV
jgi:FkbM family methyltransferase